MSDHIHVVHFDESDTSKFSVNRGAFVVHVGKYMTYGERSGANVFLATAESEPAYENGFSIPTWRGPFSDQELDDLIVALQYAKLLKAQREEEGKAKQKIDK